MKLIATLVAGLAMASAANANVPTRIVVTASGLPTAHISYADLNIGSADGRKTLTNRISAAATYLCFDSSVEPLGSSLERHDCYRAAMTSGANQMEAIAAADETTTDLGSH